MEIGQVVFFNAIGQGIRIFFQCNRATIHTIKDDGMYLNLCGYRAVVVKCWLVFSNSLLWVCLCI